ncbi:hypothetical protein [Streptomyces sp. JB150]|uniref:hypothetical protein n=1 Tax=Streptomyces sp. JB150 TaxID=2714844 RepID=UPI00140DE845|nr:hypothetical protein [Streptomyces sp. JB150]QIJ62438.1 hypothetical protein G7Z13_10595 [Streptomyces sp. JB150]
MNAPTSESMREAVREAGRERGWASRDNYPLQRAVFDRLRHGDAAAAPAGLAESDAALLRAGDLRGLADRGVHPVLINAFARALGITRADYRRLLAAGRPAAREGVARWRAS